MLSASCPEETPQPSSAAHIASRLVRRSAWLKRACIPSRLYRFCRDGPHLRSPRREIDAVARISTVKVFALLRPDEIPARMISLSISMIDDVTALRSSIRSNLKVRASLRSDSWLHPALLMAFTLKCQDFSDSSIWLTGLCSKS